MQSDTTMGRSLYTNHSVSLTFGSNSALLERYLWKSTTYNMMGLMIRPIVYTDGSPGLNAVAARSLTLVSSMSYMLNFTFKVVYGDGWVSVGPNGSLNGVGKLLEDSIGDFLCQTHELTIERATRIDFVFPTVTHREEAFFRQPFRIYENIIFRPFTTQLQLALALMGIAFVIMIWMVLNFSSYTPPVIKNKQSDDDGPCRCHQSRAVSNLKYNKNIHPCKFKRIMAIVEAVVWVLALFTQQGWNDESAMGGRTFQIVSLSGLWLSLVSNLLYSAKILSIVKTRDGPITSFEQLLTSGMKILVDRDAQNVVNLAKEFMDTTNATVIEKRTLSADDGLAVILSGSRAAFISYKFYVENVAKNLREQIYYENYCHLISSVLPSPRELQVYNGMFVRKKSPLRPILRLSLIRIKETGLMRSILQTEFEYPRWNSGKCTRRTEKIESLPFSMMAPGFFLLCLLMSTSLIVLFAENFYRNSLPEKT